MAPHATQDLGDFPEWAFDTPEYEKKVTLEKQRGPRVACADGLYDNRDAVSPREARANVMVLTDTDLEEVKCAVMGFESTGFPCQFLVRESILIDENFQIETWRST